MIGTPMASKDIIYHFARRIQNVLIESNRSNKYCVAINTKIHIATCASDHTNFSKKKYFNKNLYIKQRFLFLFVIIFVCIINPIITPSFQAVGLSVFGAEERKKHNLLWTQACLHSKEKKTHSE